MSIDPSLVAKGKCYVTANGQVRRVVQITVDDYVEYQYRGPSYQLGEKSWSFAYSGVFGHLFRRHPATHTGVSGHL